MVSSINANAMGGMGGGHAELFLGINTMKDMCHMISEDNTFTYMGETWNQTDHEQKICFSKL